ncbi:hypothetical protein DPMN_039538 [Dreissena polymorpha]|uniref:Uncharacterized protein n=1 Tax=Dreissena polymorpha TaxID=45954 RepID=A0A9D4CWE0_DREPO|nr:hypothetical protein DPMN_039538 [Dreissena polymorpha]
MYLPFTLAAAVVRPGDQFVNNAIQTATERVNAAINITRSELFQRGRTHNVQDLMTLFRYPSAESLELARAEEIFEETLELIYKHVAEGHQYNLTGHGMSPFIYHVVHLSNMIPANYSLWENGV